MICGTVHSFAALPASVLAVSFCYRVAASTSLPPLAVGSHVLTTHGDDLPIVAQVRF